jgi:hypothetical protein
VGAAVVQSVYRLCYGLDDRCSIPDRGNCVIFVILFPLHHRVLTVSAPPPASYPVGTRAVTPGVKRPSREADHSPPSTSEFKDAWSYASTPQYAFMFGA